MLSIGITFWKFNQAEKESTDAASKPSVKVWNPEISQVFNPAYLFLYHANHFTGKKETEKQCREQDGYSRPQRSQFNETRIDM